jgi:hypothetical protein
MMSSHRVQCRRNYNKICDLTQDSCSTAVLFIKEWKKEMRLERESVDDNGAKRGGSVIYFVGSLIHTLVRCSILLQCRRRVNLQRLGSCIIRNTSQALVSGSQHNMVIHVRRNLNLGFAELRSIG